jgi:hypothetical protein
LAPHANEDQIVVVPDALYGVVDGATDISGARFDDRLGAGATGGRLAARAVAIALAELAAAPFPALPEPARVLDATGAAVAAVYRRLGIDAAATRSGDHRFRAAFVAAFLAGDAVRLLAIGDCAARINGREMLRREFPGDLVLSAARSEAWRLLAGRGVAPDVARAAVRRLIVEGLDPARPAREAFAGAELAAIRDAVTGRADLRAAVGGDGRVRQILDAGLQGIRAAPGEFGAAVVDGIEDPSGAVLVRDLALADVETIELFSDGYPATADAVSVASWEAALAHADAVDPERVGTYPSTKGRDGRKFGDDRSILIVRTKMQT